MYRTDHKGRIKEVYADDLSLLDGGRNSYAQRTVGREDRLPDDDDDKVEVKEIDDN